MTRAGSDPELVAARRRYWRANLRAIAILLTIWAVAGLGCGIVFVDVLDTWSIGGFPLGFWFAQQGSIVVFVLLILVYAIWMGRIDRHHRKELARIEAASAASRSEGERT